MQTIEITDELGFQRTLRRLAHQILENNPEPEKLILAGILRRGVPLADCLAEMMEEFGGVRPAVETLDITLYRDDLSELSEQPNVRPAPRWMPSFIWGGPPASVWRSWLTAATESFRSIPNMSEKTSRLHGTSRFV